MKIHPILRNIAAAVVGAVCGGIVNMGIITISPLIIPYPDGYNPSNTQTIQATAHLLEPKHLLMAFLAHALGTFVGAYVAARLAYSHKMMFALGIAGLTLIGGIGAAVMIPAPTWFIVMDLALAYLPMGYLAGKLVLMLDPKN